MNIPENNNDEGNLANQILEEIIGFENKMESNKENFSEILGLKQEEMNENQKKPWNFEYKDKNMKIRELLEQQITQMDQTIKTLIRLNKEQYWQMQGIVQQNFFLKKHIQRLEIQERQKSDEAERERAREKEKSIEGDDEIKKIENETDEDEEYELVRVTKMTEEQREEGGSKYERAYTRAALKPWQSLVPASVSDNLPSHTFSPPAQVKEFKPKSKRGLIITKTGIQRVEEAAGKTSKPKEEDVRAKPLAAGLSFDNFGEEEDFAANKECRSEYKAAKKEVIGSVFDRIKEENLIVREGSPGSKTQSNDVVALKEQLREGCLNEDKVVLSNAIFKAKELNLEQYVNLEHAQNKLKAILQQKQVIQ